jgi:hypothetical protein
LKTIKGGSRHGEGEEQRERRHSARGGAPGVAAASVPIGNLGSAPQPIPNVCMGPGGLLGSGPGFAPMKHRVVEHPIAPSGMGSNVAIASSSVMSPPPPPSSSQPQTAATNNSTGSFKYSYAVRCA